MGPEPSKGREVVIGIRIGLGLRVKGGDGGRGQGVELERSPTERVKRIPVTNGNR